MSPPPPRLSSHLPFFLTSQPVDTCKPTSQTKKLLSLFCEEQSFLDTAALDKGRSEEDESASEVVCVSCFLTRVTDRSAGSLQQWKPAAPLLIAGDRGHCI